MAEEAERDEREHQHVPQIVDDLDARAAHRLAGLDDARREAPGEVVLKIAQRMSERIDMAAPADPVRDLRNHDLVHHRMVGEIDQRPEYEDDDCAGDQPSAIVGTRPPASSW